MPKILVVPGWYPGVIEQYNGDFVRDQVKMLRNDGLSMDLVYADLNIAYLRHLQKSKRYTVRCDEYGNKDYVMTGPFWPKNNSLGFSKWKDAYIGWVERYIQREGKPSILHAHTYLGAIVSAKIKKKYGLPLIVTEHFTGWMDGSIRKSHRDQGIYALQQADCVTAVSRSLREELAKHTSREIIVLPNFIDTDLFNFTNSAASRIGKIICVGDLIHRKQVDHVIRAFSLLRNKHKNVNLTIVGSGPEENSLKQLVRNLNLSAVISFVGQKRKKAVAKLLQSSDVLIHASKVETFGLVMAEALCCGTRVISYSNGGVDMMSHLPGIYITETNEIASLVHLTNKVLDDSKLDKKLISDEARSTLGVKVIKPLIGSLYERLFI